MCNVDIFYNGLWTCMWAYTVSMGVDIEHVWCEHVDNQNVDYEHVWCKHMDHEQIDYEHVWYEHVCCEHACWLCTCMLLA